MASSRGSLVFPRFNVKTQGSCGSRSPAVKFLPPMRRVRTRLDNYPFYNRSTGEGHKKVGASHVESSRSD